jgi:hypothetical protein
MATRTRAYQTSAPVLLGLNSLIKQALAGTLPAVTLETPPVSRSLALGTFGDENTDTGYQTDPNSRPPWRRFT